MIESDEPACADDTRGQKKQHFERARKYNIPVKGIQRVQGDEERFALP